MYPVLQLKTKHIKYLIYSKVGIRGGGVKLQVNASCLDSNVHLSLYFHPFSLFQVFPFCSARNEKITFHVDCVGTAFYLFTSLQFKCVSYTGIACTVLQASRSSANSLSKNTRLKQMLSQRKGSLPLGLEAYLCRVYSIRQLSNLNKHSCFRVNSMSQSTGWLQDVRYMNHICMVCLNDQCFLYVFGPLNEVS